MSDDGLDFGLKRGVIDSPKARLESWAMVGSSGCTNGLQLDGVFYSWDAHPRQLANGAVQGRVYAKRRGALGRDIGGFKIGADGTVLKIPRELAGVLPGAERAETDNSQGDQT